MIDPLELPLEHLKDTDGRPLREQAATVAARAGVPFELVECRYPGSRFRHAKPMNVSALRQMNTHWEDIVDGLGTMRSFASVAEVRYIDLWRIAQRSELLPRWLVYRADAPLSPDVLPPAVAGMYKIVAGLSGALLDLALTTLVMAPERFDAKVDLDELYGYIEAEQLLVGPSQVCAGPETLIRRAIGVMLEAPPDEARGTGGVRQLIGDESRFERFTRASMTAIVTDGIFALIAESLYSRLRAGLVDAAGGPGGPLDRLLEPADGRLALLAGFDDTTGSSIVARALEQGVLASDGDGVVRACDALAKVLLLDDEWPSADAMSGLLDARAPETSVAEVAKYLRLERASWTLSRVLKGEILRSLGHDGTPLEVVSAGFRPPNPRVRQLLAIGLGVVFVSTGVTSRRRRFLALE